MRLLVITSSWPHSTVPEFLHDEIVYLVSRFRGVVVAPMRPKDCPPSRVPTGVEIDYTLSHWLEHVHPLGFGAARHWTAAARAIRANPDRFGFSNQEFVHDWRKARWLRASLLARADSTSVALWAQRASLVPDIAYTFWLGAATVGLRRAWPTVPLVSRVHGGDLYSEAEDWDSIPFQRPAVRAVDLLASASEAGRRYMSGKFPEADERIAVRRLGIRDLGGLAEPSTHARLRILSASSVDSNKRVNLIGEVAQHLALNGQDVDWTHLGDGPARAEVEGSLGSPPARLNIYLRGQVPLEEVHREMRFGKHDVFVNLSLSEGAPVSLMEAQCAGLPVVATKVGGTPEVVPAQWNELVEVRQKPTSIAEAVLRARSRPQEQRKSRRQHWMRQYRAEDNYAAWAEELTQLADTGRPIW